PMTPRPVPREVARERGRLALVRASTLQVMPHDLAVWDQGARFHRRRETSPTGIGPRPGQQPLLLRRLDQSGVVALARFQLAPDIAGDPDIRVHADPPQ